MRKVLDYGLFARSIAGVGGAVNGARTKDMYIAELKAEYPPTEGWEIVSSEYAGTTAEGFIIFIVLQKVAYA